MDLTDLERQASACELCELYKGQNQSVFAKGSEASNIVVCGMCPGPEENKVGIPFVGDAGKILDKIFLEAFGNDSLSLDVYITNLVKCFVPPGTQLQQKWMITCLPYFIVQVKLINPRIIVALGKDVSNFLLNNTLPMKSMRGKLFDYMGIKLLSTYHPSYLVRSGGTKHKHFQTVVNDFKQIYKYM